jgi:RNA polymerase sigma-70 factor (ECF subfamily)
MDSQGSPHTTQRLLGRARRNEDPEALNALCDRLRARLAAWVAARLGPRLRARVEVEDIVQETLMNVSAALSGFDSDDERRFRAWVFKIAERCINRQADWHGAAKRDPAKEVDVHSRLEAAQTSPSARAARAEDWASTLDAVAGLPENLRLVFRLKMIEGLTNSEVAEKLGISIKNVSVRYVRALTKLKAARGL